jgi:hypothetical protein
MRQVQHDGGILADGVQHHRLFTLRGNLAHDVDAFRFELAQVGEFGLKLLSLAVMFVPAGARLAYQEWSQAGSEAMASRDGARRRGRGGQAAMAAGLTGVPKPLPPLVNPLPPLELIGQDQLMRIVDAAYRVLEEAGLEILSDQLPRYLRCQWLQGGPRHEAGAHGPDHG